MVVLDYYNYEQSFLLLVLYRGKREDPEILLFALLHTLTPPPTTLHPTKTIIVIPLNILFTNYRMQNNRNIIILLLRDSMNTMYIIKKKLQYALIALGVGGDGGRGQCH